MGMNVCVFFFFIIVVANRKGRRSMAAMKVEKSLLIVAPAKDKSEEWTKEM